MKIIKDVCLPHFKKLFQENRNNASLESTNLEEMIEISESTQEKFGHYQCNSAMKLSKILGLKPREIAEKIVADIKHSIQHANEKDYFSNIEIAGPGFINFTFKPEFLSDLLNEILQDARLNIHKTVSPKKVIIDFSSPNIAKDMHVGHLRSTIIGDSLAKILEFLGHSVLRLNHIGDWGTQFGMLIAHLKTVLPTITQEKTPDVDLNDLVKWYRESKHRFDNDPEFKKQAQQEVVALQKGEPTSVKIWQHICAISKKAYQQIYDLLDIQINDRGESFYNSLLPKLVSELEQKGLVKESDGAKCIFLEDFKNREGEPLPIILQKSDGGFNYSTTDMAALKHRVQDEKGNWLIYVTDAGQSLHFQMIFSAAEKAGFYNPESVRIDHVPFGLVLGPDGKKFKTRSGDTERLMDLLTTAIDKAKGILLERTPDISGADLEKASHALGINAVKYSDLSCHRISDYVFSYDKMLKFEGNTAAFLLYAYVRVQSIQRKANVSIADLIAAKQKVVLEEPIEVSLGLLLCRFSELLNSISNDLLPNRLTDYLYNVAEKFHTFFHQCRVEGSAQQNSRLLLCEAVKRTLLQGFQLLGLKPLEKM